MRPPALDAPAGPLLPMGGGGTAPGDPAPTPLGPDVRRAFTALLRARAHHLPRTLPPRLAAAARLLPALLHASFEQRPLDSDAPGVAGLRYRPRWSSLARRFGLPPPCRAQRGRTLIDAVLVLPAAGELHALAMVPAGLSAEQLCAVQERLEGVQEVFAAAGAPVRAVLCGPDQLGRDREACNRLTAFGALLAGSLSQAAWEALEASRRLLPAHTTSALAAGAPAPLAALALTLMTRAPCPGPLDAAVALLVAGVALRDLADPETFCVRWAGLVPGLRALLYETLLLTGPEEPRGVVRAGAHPAPREPLDLDVELDIDLVLDFEFDGTATPSPLNGSPKTALARLVTQGRALAHACAVAIRASRLGRANRSTQRLWREALGPGMPRVLLPALGARLAEEAAAGRLTLNPTRAGRVYEVRLPDGTVLGRGASPVQARVRALGLVAAADAARPGTAVPGGASSVFAGLDSTWREVGRQLGRPREHATLMMVLVSGGGARPGPPMDLLNRGPERALEFDGALAVLLVPGRRPSGSMLSAAEAVHAVIRRAQAGASLEMLAASSAARPVAARLARIAAMLRDPPVTGPVAIEAGGRVVVAHGPGTRTFPLARFAARPRVFTPDPGAPDISISTGERQGPRSRPPGVVQCRVVALNAHTAALLYADDAGAHLREEVPFSELEERMRDAREIVRAATPPAALAVGLSEDLEPAVRRAGPPGARLGVLVSGALPFVEVEIAGERFGGASPLGWGAAAEALLARWPAGGEAMLGVSAVTATARGARLPPLLALYAGSVARRRLRTHLARAMASYRTAAVGRREG